LGVVTEAAHSVSLPPMVVSTPKEQTTRAVTSSSRLVDLKVSKPILLLNAIANRYSKTSRIVMEYVDNSFDSAELFYDRNRGRYKVSIDIDIYIEEINGERGVRVVDNCNGMSFEMLKRLISNIGDSTKRSSRFTNGQFGFGIHAFRAAAEHIRFRSRDLADGPVRELTMDKNNTNFTVTEAPTDSMKKGTGTSVEVWGFDRAWRIGLNAKDIADEISFHFDRLLDRKRLKVRIHERGQEHIVSQFDYAKMKGIKIFEDFPVGKGICQVRMVVSYKTGTHGAYFISNGRRVNQLTDVDSFMKKSKGKQGVWGHPCLIGYISVDNICDPVITRDDFRRTAKRQELYRLIHEKIEPRIHAALKKENDKKRVKALSRLEDVIAKCFTSAVRKDKQRDRDKMTYVDQMEKLKKEEEIKEKKAHIMDLEELPERDVKDDDKKTDEKKEKKKKRPRKDGEITIGDDGEGNGFQIQFVDKIVGPDNKARRAHLVGNMVQINVSHTDFVNRVRYTSDGRHPLVTERLCAYLANVASAAFKSNVILRSPEGLDKYRESHSRLFKELLNITMNLESSLRLKLGLMQKRVSGQPAAKKRKH